MKALENDELAKQMQLKISNNFINSPFRYSQIELDVLFMLLTVWTKSENEYSFAVSQLANITGRWYRQPELLEETRRLMSNVYTITMKETKGDVDAVTISGNTNNDGASNEDELSWITYVLFSSISYRRGVITAKLTDQAMALFANTKTKYTHLQLKSALLLTSKYAKRLYMLLSEWAFTGTKKYSLDELRQILTPGNNKDNDDDSGSYKDNYDFKVLIEKAVSDINRITELHIDVTFGKQQRSLVSVTFSINSTSELKLPLGESAINFNYSAEKNEFLGRCKHYGLSENQAMEMWDRGCRLEDFTKIMKDVNKVYMKSNGSIKNVPGYIATCCANAGFLNIDKSQKDLNKASRNSKKKQHLEERNRIVTMIRQSLAAGTDISAFTTFFDTYNINPDELR